jgi:CheY-like chemotaxis protein
MPVMDGILSTSQIRRFEKKNSLPPSRIIAVTGVGASDTQQQALAAGMDDYMVKPVRLTALKKMMNLS